MSFFDSFATLWNSIDILQISTGAYAGATILLIFAAIAFSLLINRQKTRFFFVSAYIMLVLISTQTWNRSINLFLIFGIFPLLLPIALRAAATIKSIHDKMEK